MGAGVAGGEISLGGYHHDLVQGCQLRCPGCPLSTKHQPIRVLDPADLERDLRNTDVARVDVLRLFNYSEPLLHPDLPGILGVVAHAPWPIGCVEISTNGQFARWDQLERAIGMGVIDRFMVSCDGDGSPEDYERLRPPGKFERLVELLERVAELRDRRAPAMQLMTRTIISSEADKRPWRALLERHGWVPEFRSWKWLPEAKENLTGREIVPAAGVCKFLEPCNQLYVAWDGTVVPCCAHPGAGSLGNLREQLFSEILSGDRRARFVEAMSSRRGEMPVCSNCEFGPAAAPGPSAGNRA